MPNTIPTPDQKAALADWSNKKQAEVSAAYVKPVPAKRAPFAKLPHNARVEEYLAANGLPGVMAKWLSDGSMKGHFQLTGYHRNSKGQRDRFHLLPWTAETANKLTSLGFLNFWGKPFDTLDGNGGCFSVAARPPASLDPRYVVEVA